jgi:hypothetical protein
MPDHAIQFASKEALAPAETEPEEERAIGLMRENCLIAASSEHLAGDWASARL